MEKTLTSAERREEYKKMKQTKSAKKREEHLVKFLKAGGIPSKLIAGRELKDPEAEEIRKSLVKQAVLGENDINVVFAKRELKAQGISGAVMVKRILES